MNARLIRSVAAGCFVFLLPGCGRLIDWGKNTFYQGETLDEDSKQARQYVRWAHVYDQLETRAIFDAIWLSNDVRTAYAHLYTARQGKSEDHQQAFLRRQLEENNHFTTFYVLSLYDISLGDSDSAWSIFLDIDGQQSLPIEVKAVDMPQEFNVFFGNRHTRFKDAYRVKFDARDIQDRLLITKKTQQVALHFRTVDKQVVLIWALDENGDLIEQRMTGGVPAFTHRQREK